MATKANPGEFDCYANAKDDEPMFVLLARDEHAPRLVEDWAAAYMKTKMLNGELDTRIVRKYEEALRCAIQMRIWREENH